VIFVNAVQLWLRGLRVTRRRSRRRRKGRRDAGDALETRAGRCRLDLNGDHDIDHDVV
jgi:hypothetical protein